MTRTFSRLAGGLVASVLVGAALMLVTSPAGASTSTVSFTGSSPLGLPALACNSTPDQSAVTLTTADTLNVENLTGHSASIYINGAKSGSVVGANQSVPITSGKDYTITLLPDCLLNLSDAGTVSVTVVAPEPVPAAVPVPALTTAPPVVTSTPSSKAAGPRSDPTSASTSGTAKHHHAATPATSAPEGSASATPSATTSPAPSSATGGASKSGGSSGKSGSSHAKGTTSGGSSGRSSTSGPDGTTTAQAGAPSDGVTIGDAQTLPAAEIVPASPNYLLVVIAFILVVGVGWASVRAVFTQRRTRRAEA